MNYKLLKNCFHDSKIDYEEEYTKRFESMVAVHLPFAVGEYQAFFLRNIEVSDLIYQIQKENKNIEKKAAKLSEYGALRTLLNTCLFKEIEQSNAMEEVHSSRKTLALMSKTSERKNTYVRFAGQLKQYSALLRNSLTVPTDSLDIRRIYDVLLADDIRLDDPSNLPDGEIFRKDAVYVNGGLKNIHRGIFPEKEIVRVIDETLATLENTLSPLRAAVFHFVFEYAHPFYDGNGRMGRFLSTLQLCDDFHLAGVLQLSLKLREHRHAYYEIFRTCENALNRADLTPFVLFFLTQLLEAMREGNEMLEKKIILYDAGIARIDREDPKQGTEHHFMTLMLHAALFEPIGLRQAEIKEALNCSDSTVKKLIGKHRDDLYIEKDGAYSLYSLHYDYLK